MRTRCRHTLLIPAICSALVLLLGACRDPQIVTYNAPKEAASEPSSTMPAGHPDTNGMPAMNAPSASASTDMTNASATGMPVGSDALTWTAPADWKTKPASQMRKGSYAVPAPAGTANAGDADLAIFAFPGDTGGLLGNINRWRGQIGLGPLQENDIPANITQLTATQDSVQFTLVDFVSNDSATRMLGAILPGKGETYFFKMTGPAATVAAQKDAFLGMLKTVKVQ